MAILEPPGPPLDYSTTFSVDAMFYSAARKARERADRAVAGIRRAEKKVFICKMKMARVREKAEEDDRGEYRYYDELEPLAIQMENLEFGVVEAHGPVLRESRAGPHPLRGITRSPHQHPRRDPVVQTRLDSLREDGN
jgi:hypothetical protein